MVAPTSKPGINAGGVGIAAAGLLVIYAAFANVGVLELLRSLAGGTLPKPEPKKPFEPVTIDWTGTTRQLDEFDLNANSSAILNAAQFVATSAAGRRNYCWGGGHTSNPCGAKCFDCSGYVSCVLNKLGLMKGSKNTTGFKAWGGLQKVEWGSRKPGDIIISLTHMGIIIDDNTMWNAACTKCGPVKKSQYSLTSSTGKYAAYRLKNASGVGFASGGVKGNG